MVTCEKYHQGDVDRLGLLWWWCVIISTCLLWNYVNFLLINWQPICIILSGFHFLCRLSNLIAKVLCGYIHSVDLDEEDWDKRRWQQLVDIAHMVVMWSRLDFGDKLNLLDMTLIIQRLLSPAQPWLSHSFQMISTHLEYLSYLHCGSHLAENWSSYLTWFSNQNYV